MNEKVSWGVLGVADIAVKRVIPAMQLGESTQIVAIASRDLKRAQQAAEQRPQASARLTALMRISWLIRKKWRPFTTRCPTISTSLGQSKRQKLANMSFAKSRLAAPSRQAISLLKTRDRTGVKIEEAFMVCTHPQWRGVLDLIRKGRIGEVRSVMGYFS